VKFLKSQIASSAGTAVDFITATTLVHLFEHNIVQANLTGNIAGGITNFYLGRIWVFNSKQHALHSQFIRYVLVWIGNVFLNTGGVFLMTRYTTINFIYSKVIVSVLIGFFYNYLLQHKFVFKKDDTVEYEV
jgi:putative flippase GtrA